MVSASFAATLPGTVDWDKRLWSCSADNHTKYAIDLKGVYFKGDKGKGGHTQEWIKLNQTVAAGETITIKNQRLTEIEYARYCFFKY